MRRFLVQHFFASGLGKAVFQEAAIPGSGRLACSLTLSRQPDVHASIDMKEFRIRHPWSAHNLAEIFENCCRRNFLSIASMQPQNAGFAFKRLDKFIWRSILLGRNRLFKMFLLQFCSLDFNVVWRRPILWRRKAIKAIGCTVRNLSQHGRGGGLKACLNCNFSFVLWSAICLSCAVEALNKGRILTNSLRTFICGSNLKLDRLKAWRELPKRFLNHQISKWWHPRNWCSSTIWSSWQHISLIRISLHIQAKFHKLGPELIILQMQPVHFIHWVPAWPFRLHSRSLSLSRCFRCWMLWLFFPFIWGARRWSISCTLSLLGRGTRGKTWFSHWISCTCYSYATIHCSTRWLTLTLVNGLRILSFRNSFKWHFRCDSCLFKASISSPDSSTWCLLVVVLRWTQSHVAISEWGRIPRYFWH